MQMMFAVMFLIMIVVTMTYGSKTTNDDIASKSSAVAWQMAAWHNAAVDLCVYNPSSCLGGVLSPRSALNQAFQNGQAFNSGSYVSVYDPVSNRVLTYLAGHYQRAGITSASVASAMTDTFLSPSNEVGVFDGSKIQPFRPYWLVHSPNDDPNIIAAPIPLNSSFGGQTIPKDVPVILARICELRPNTPCS